MDNLLAKIQMFFFDLGSKKEHFAYEAIGNKIQDFRSKHTIK